MCLRVGGPQMEHYLLFFVSIFSGWFIADLLLLYLLYISSTGRNSSKQINRNLDWTIDYFYEDTAMGIILEKLVLFTLYYHVDGVVDGIK